MKIDTQSQLNNKAIKLKYQFIINFGKAAHAYGSSSIRLEKYLGRLSNVLEVDGHFRVTPNQLVFAFSEEGNIGQTTYLSSVTSGSFDMHKLAKLDELVGQLDTKEISIEDAFNKFEDIQNLKNPFGSVWTGLSYIFAGVGFAGILFGSWMDVLFSGLMSLIVYGSVLLSKKSERWTNLIPISTAFVVAVLTVLLKHFFIHELNYTAVTLSAIIILIPGYSVSIGISELVNNHVISGLTNLINGLVYLIKQFVGAWFGFSLVLAFVDLSPTIAQPIDPTWMWILIPILIVALPIVFQTSANDFGWALLSCTMAYLGFLFGSELGGSNIGILIGSILAGVFANTWEWKTRKPGSIVLLPAVMILVSGSIGFRGLVSVAQGNADGTTQFLDMFIIAATLAAGFIIADSLIKPKYNL